MPILVNKYLMGSRFSGVAIWPFIIVKRKSLQSDIAFINHEKIHLRQQLELGILFFYIWYLLEFLVKWMYYKNAHTAYLQISFEREAYNFEDDTNYLSKRKFWDFRKFL